MNLSGWPLVRVTTSLVAILADDIPIPWQLLPAPVLRHHAFRNSSITVCGATPCVTSENCKKNPKMLVLRQHPFPASVTVWPAELVVVKLIAFTGI